MTQNNGADAEVGCALLLQLANLGVPGNMAAAFPVPPAFGKQAISTASISGHPLTLQESDEVGAIPPRDQLIQVGPLGRMTNCLSLARRSAMMRKQVALFLAAKIYAVEFSVLLRPADDHDVEAQ